MPEKNDFRPGDVIGYKKSGDPIRLQAGGDENHPVTEPQHQDPTPTPTPPAPNQPRTFTEADLEKARQEEKNKLYGRLQKQEEQFNALQDELSKINQEREERQAEEAKRREAADAEAKAKEREELSAKELLDKREEEWNNRFQQLQEQQAQREALWEQEKKFQDLANYTARRVSEEQENIAPELLDYITGNTEQEIEQSITTAKAKSAAIVEAMQKAQAQARAAMPGVSTAGYAATGPMDTNPVNESYSAEDINNMSLQEYQQLRGKLGIGNAQGKGLFG
jgi:colicin import membrane protein